MWNVYDIKYYFHLVVHIEVNDIASRDALHTKANFELLSSMHFRFFFPDFFFVYIFLTIYSRFSKKPKQPKRKVDFSMVTFVSTIYIRLFVVCFLFTPFSVCLNCGLYFVCLNISWKRSVTWFLSSSLCSDSNLLAHRVDFFLWHRIFFLLSPYIYIVVFCLCHLLDGYSPLTNNETIEEKNGISWIQIFCLLFLAKIES